MNNTNLKRIISSNKIIWNQWLQKAATSQPFVLVCTSIGNHQPVVTHDTLITAALVARGVRVEVLLCDGALPACELCTIYEIQPDALISEGPQTRFCRSCFAEGTKSFKDLGIQIHRYSDYLNREDYAESQKIVSGLTDSELKTFRLNGINLGEEAYAGTLRFFAVGDLYFEPQGPAIMRKYLQSAILTLWTIQRLFQKHRPDVTVFHHGIYVPQGVIGQAARQQNIRVVNWAVGYRKNTFVYSHEDTYHRTMIDEPVEAWKERLLTDIERERLLDYLEARRTSSQDWIKVHQEPEEDKELIRKQLNFDNRPVILLLTNVTWDAQLYYKNNGFPSLLDWMEYSIQYFRNREDLQLVIRVHPAEVRGTMISRQPVMEVMKKRIPTLPANVSVVDAHSSLSTYTLAEMADCTIIYGTKTGVELTARGLPVIVTGEAWIKNKGLTIDITTEEEYHAFLDKLPLRKKMDPEQIELAQQYAFHYFFRRLIPVHLLAYVQKSPSLWSRGQNKLRRLLKLDKPRAFIASNFSISVDGLDDIKPGSDPGLDIICKGITQGTPFIFEPINGK